MTVGSFARKGPEVYRALRNKQALDFATAHVPDTFMPCSDDGCVADSYDVDYLSYVLIVLGVCLVTLVGWYGVVFTVTTTFKLWIAFRRQPSSDDTGSEQAGEAYPDLAV
eukprot:CAMPEP_0114566856 /NCGR_PEP_ID=MMETSP0114-20121206/15135_1 /TAXON_ID=31324 /ORGANISM="Goniomonas sp, Strain m" /LENGTH=109 /DNA_ID=CAMNT_0001753335 /DNA_START=108 /DNA_END=433 /DNA_ORIENTATION=-